MNAPWPQTLPKRWLTELSQRFGRTFTQPELLHQAENASWLLSEPSGQVFVLKLYRPTASGLMHLEQEIRLLSRLKSRGFAAPAYLYTADATALLRLDGLYATLQPALHGLMWIHPEPEAYEGLGRCLRRLHDLSAELRDLPLKRYDFESGLGDQAWRDVAEAPFLPAELKQSLDAWRRQIRSEFDFRDDCLIHCDAHWGNLIVTADGPCLIDWEEAGWGHALLDLATVEIHLLRSNRDRTAEVDALHRGYGSTPDRRQLNLAMSVRLMWLLSKIPSRLDIPELRDPLGIFERYRGYFQELLGPAKSG